ncbi:hypothetical protein J1N35_007566 [Gossypium stocksii]|uniref:Uncharacterized protein n=1 Tax=Gossypium stocksii TaxID=47602 RepID=A0A9D3W7Q2_9ROSI|nr:hypothetical protein J1N35_007566 [Gossypium stocksii]
MENCVLGSFLEFTVSKGGSSKVSVKMLTKYESVTTTPKFKRRKVSTIRDFLPGCERGATMDLRLNRQIAIDQGKCSLSIKLLLELEEEDDEGEEPTVEKQTTKHEGDAKKTKYVHFASEKEDDDVTQAPTPVNTTTTMTPRLKASMTAQEHVVHQLIDKLTKLDFDSKDEVPINQLKRNCFKTTAGKAVLADSVESER